MHSKTLMLIVLCACLPSLVHAVSIEQGVRFTTETNNYTATENLTASSVNVTDILYVNDSQAARFTNHTMTLTSLASGSQDYNTTATVSTGLYAVRNCSIIANQQDQPINYSTINGTLCEGLFSLNQSPTNSFRPQMHDDKFRIIYRPDQQGVEIAATDNFSTDTEAYGNLSRQYFLRTYNLTNHLDNLSVPFSPTEKGIERPIDLSPGANQRNGSEAYDLVSIDDWNIPGSTFEASEGYGIERNLTYTNTRENDLPATQMALSLEQYESDARVEQQSPTPKNVTSVHNGSRLLFNLSSINANTTEEYEYGYDAVVFDWSGDNSADYRLSGSYKDWTLDRLYSVYFNLTGKTVKDTIETSKLGEWGDRLADWESTLTNSDGESYSHLTIDNVENVTLSFDPPEDDYSYKLTYTTPITSSGGGGGGGGASLPEPEEEENVSEIVEEKMRPEGFIKFMYPGHTRKILFLPTQNFTKEVVVTAFEGDVQATLNVSSQIQQFFNVQVCKPYSMGCNTTASFNEGDQLYVTIRSNLTTPEFEEMLLEQDTIQGQLWFSHQGKRVSDTYNLTIEKSRIFDETMELTRTLNDNGIPANQKQVTYTGGISATALLIFIIVSFLPAL